MGEAPLKAAMIRYGLDILGLSILISIIISLESFIGVWRWLPDGLPPRGRDPSPSLHGGDPQVAV